MQKVSKRAYGAVCETTYVETEGGLLTYIGVNTLNAMHIRQAPMCGDSVPISVWILKHAHFTTFWLMAGMRTKDNVHSTSRRSHR